MTAARCMQAGGWSVTSATLARRSSAPAALARLLSGTRLATGESADDMIATYTSGGAAVRLRRRPRGGEWTLRVADEAAQDVGKLNRWKPTAET